MKKSLINSLSKSNGIYPFFLAALIAVNLFIFAKSIFIPVEWQHQEIKYYQFFWSKNLTGPQPDQLHLGMSREDWIKPFMTKHNETVFRLRPVSVFADMLSLKFWQLLEVVSFRNYTYILLHVLNAFLLWNIFARMSRDPALGAIPALLFLNSGIALSSLLLPFKITKFLLVTLFLVTWWLLTKRPHTKVSLGLFVLTIFLMLFTDETAVFFLLLPFIFLFFQTDIPQSTKRNLILTLCGLIVVFFASALILKNVSANLEGKVNLVLQETYFERVKTLLQTKLIIGDNLIALIFFFLRKVFGYWDRTVLGGAAFLSSLGLLYIMLRETTAERRMKILAGIFFAALIIQSFVIPHPGGVHPNVMPQGTKFPSLLFFSHYYPYPHTVLLLVGVGLLLSFIPNRNGQTGLLFLVLTTMISFSNLHHVEKEIYPTLTKDWFYYKVTPPGEALRHILSIRKLSPNQPVYLSFPSGSKETVEFKFKKGKQLVLDSAAVTQKLDLDFHIYATIIPVQFLRSLQEGKLLMSLNNIAPKKPEGKLEQAANFYDVPTETLFNLNGLKNQYGQSAFTPRIIEKRTTFTEQVAPGARQLIFFVKGGADITINQSENLTQTYGHSYQKFAISLENQPASVHLTIQPRGEKAYLIGPFFL